MNFEDDCNAEVKLKTYKPLVKIFKLNICENTSASVNQNLIKIVHLLINKI